MRKIRIVWIGILFLALSVGATAEADVFYVVNFIDSNGGYTVESSANANNPWTWNDTDKWYTNGCPGAGCGSPSYSALISPEITIPYDGMIDIRFIHEYSFEQSGGTDWDGGQLQYRLDSSVWSPISNFSEYGYTGIIDGNNILYGQGGFVGESSSITSQAQVGLGQAGQVLQFRFLAAWDECVVGEAPNWQITGIGLISSGTPAPVAEPSTVLLLGSGLAGLVGYGRRRMKK